MLTNEERVLALCLLTSAECDMVINNLTGYLQEPEQFTCHETETSVIERFIDEVLLEGFIDDE